VYIACSTLCFGKYPLDRALRAINDLRFPKVDLAIHEGGPHLKPSEVAADVPHCAQMLRTTGMSFAAFHVEIGATDLEQFKEHLRAVCRLGRLLTVPVVNIPAAPAGTDLAEEVQRLTPLSRLAEAEGVILTVETHREQVTADPKGAAELCRRVPGLGLTLDPSHYIAGPHPTEDFGDLYPHVRHVRLRDTSGEKLQVRVGQGRLEYGKIITHLDRERYNRALTVDIRDLPDEGYPMESEVRKLKYLLESMV
jgi:sugar phosphate isomerase/epimerase